MKTLLTTISLIVSATLCAQINDPSPYCVSKYRRNYNMFEFLTINEGTQNFGPAGSWNDQNDFIYFNDAPIDTLIIGSSADVQIAFHQTFDTQMHYFALYIDYNQDNIFQANERALSNANTSIDANILSAITINETFTVPQSALSGITRMRLTRSGNVNDFMGPYNDNYAVPPCNNVTTDFINMGNSYDFDVIISTEAELSLTESIKIENTTLVYPNPSTELLNIKIDQNNVPASIRLYSNDGKLLMSYDEPVNEINIKSLQNGVYFLEIIDAKGTRECHKILKES